MMIILGHPDIPFDPLYYVETVEEIAQTPPNATLWLGSFSQSKEISKYCMKNRIHYAVMAESITDALLANALHATYILAQIAMAERLQKIAETYLFDAKIVVPIEKEADMEAVARAGIDGIVFQDAILT